MARKALIVIFLFLPQLLFSKTRHSPPVASSAPHPLVSSNKIKTLEDRFRPVLEHKVSRIKRSRGVPGILSQRIPKHINGPSDSDFLLLAQSWNSLSPEFKALYKMAASIPDSFVTIASPGGHFDISYTVKGPDGVDETDNYGYSSVNWRTKEEASNGIPDYIDEVGWALDSCRSAYIDRFGLAPPTPFLQNGGSQRYGVIVYELQSNMDYGLTWPGEKDSNSSKGYSSYISLRNSWPSSEWKKQGYDQHPQSGIRVTCAHEFFHAVQYAMSWKVAGDIYLDNFPLSWIEGSATAMEEFLFPDINDYFQYADMYFGFPGPVMSFFDGSNNVYTNAILVLYLLKRTNHADDNFVTVVHKNNYASLMDFHQNIGAAAVFFNLQWAQLLNDFHSSSFFTGSQADTSRFLDDAPWYDRWNFRESGSSRDGIIKQVNPYSMQKYYIQPADSDIDTLWILLQNEWSSSQSLPQKTWAASVIVRRDSSDTVIPVQLDLKGDGLFQLAGWKSAEYALAVVSNAQPGQTLPYSVWFEFSDLTYRAGSTCTIYPSNRSDVSITLNTGTDLRGKLLIDTENDLEKYEMPDSVNLITTAYNITIPGSWKNDRYKDTVTLSIRLPNSNLWTESTGSASIYRFNSISSAWEKQNTGLSYSSDSIILSAIISESGVYGIRKPYSPDMAIKGGILVYPNRISIRKSSPDSLYISGADISEIRVYTIDGQLKYRDSPSQSTSLKRISRQVPKYRWIFPKQQFSPGIFPVVICYTNDSGKKRSIIQKILVTP